MILLSQTILVKLTMCSAVGLDECLIFLNSHTVYNFTQT